MKIHTLHSELWVPGSREEVFEFFSRAENLEALTPQWNYFSISSAASIAMKTVRVLDNEKQGRRRSQISS